MKYRVMVTGCAGMPDWEYGAYRSRFFAGLVAWFFNVTNPHFTLAWVEEVES